MYKKIIIQNDGRLILELPKNLQNKLLEIFVLPIDELEVANKLNQKDKEEVSDYTTK